MRITIVALALAGLAPVVRAADLDIRCEYLDVPGAVYWPY